MPSKSSSSIDWKDPAHPGDVSQSAESPTTPSPAQEDEGLPLDVTFELLKNHRRRVVLQYLAEQPSTTLSALAEHVAAQENDKPIRSLTSAERKRVYISLYQCHLPKFHDAGVVEFDSDRGTVERRAPADQLTPYLTAVSGSEPRGGAPRWHRYYLGLALLGAGLLAGQFLVSPSVTVTTILAVGIVGSFAAISIVQARHHAPSTQHPS